MDVFARDLDIGRTTLASVNLPLGRIGATRLAPSVSADGRYVAFSSGSSNLHPDDPIKTADIYVRDLQTGTTALVSRATGANGAKSNPRSATGHRRRRIDLGRRTYVAFKSAATNLSPDDTDADYDVYVRDLQANTTTLVSRATGVAGAKGDGFWPSISADGRYVAFLSYATTGSRGHRRRIRTSTCATCRRTPRHWRTAPTGRRAPRPTMAATGRQSRLTASGWPFTSSASNLRTGAPEDFEQVYVRDLQANTTTMVSRANGSSGARANDYAIYPAISPDGNRVAFGSAATNLHPADTDSFVDVYERDIPAGATTLVSRASGTSGTERRGCRFLRSVRFHRRPLRGLRVKRHQPPSG